MHGSTLCSSLQTKFISNIFKIKPYSLSIFSPNPNINGLMPVYEERKSNMELSETVKIFCLDFKDNEKFSLPLNMGKL